MSSPKLDFGVDKMGDRGFRRINFNCRDLRLIRHQNGFANVGEIAACSDAYDEVKGDLHLAVEHLYLFLRE